MFSRFARSVAASPVRAGFADKALPVVASGLSLVALTSLSSCEDDCCHPHALPWSHRGFFNSFDAASIRRGHQVYQQVCASCHGVSRIAYRNLVDVCYTEEEVKMMLEDITVEDGPDDAGQMFERTAKLFDYMQSPYKNEGEARSANAGALPPDLSLIVKARHGFDDYIFHLLTGYTEPPAGVEIREGLYYNAYFPGGAIGMPPPLMDEAVEFEDGTAATVSQMAKDVTTFLSWCAEPEHDQRKKMGTQFVGILVVAAGIVGYMKRFRWAAIKSRKVEFRQ